jgi:hypothetical protein
MQYRLSENSSTAASFYKQDCQQRCVQHLSIVIKSLKNLPFFRNFLKVCWVVGERLPKTFVCLKFVYICT